ncbi:MAG: alpha/beta fold hydrolase [Methanotrichaceae archaeon]|nr:alpha/beta fold hydrolase [Methanotrichaceae archaeon]
MTEGQEMDEAISRIDHPLITAYLFHPRKPDPGEADFPGEVLSFQMDEVIHIDCLFFPAGRHAPSLLFFHGNGEIAHNYADLGPLYAQRGINFLAADYRGYGTSSGRPEYSSLLQDAERVLLMFRDHLQKNGYRPDIFVMGRSIGSAPAIELALRHSRLLGGLIIESGFARILPLLENLGLPSALLSPDLEKSASNLEKMRKIDLSLLVIHGEEDGIIPIADGKALLSASPAANKSLLTIHRAGHNTLFLHGLDEYLDAVSGFVQSLKLGTGSTKGNFQHSG